jgi:integrase
VSRLVRSVPGAVPRRNGGSSSSGRQKRFKGEKIREIPLHPKLRDALTAWLEERQDWPGANTPALYNQRGGRLSVKGAHDVIAKLRRCAEPNSTRKSSSLKRGNFAGNFT